MARAAIGIGSNLGEPAANVRRAASALGRLGTVAARSALYRTQPWGQTDQPLFCNAVALLDTPLEPEALLGELKRLEAELGREPSPRWGPRAIDLDILLYDDLELSAPGLEIPHPRLFERAFALIPLAEVDPRYREHAEGLGREERESVALMSETLVDRVRTLAQAFLETDLMRLRIEDENEDAIELRRKSVAAAPRVAPGIPGAEEPEAPAVDVDAIKADLVGIVHFSRPPVREGDRLEGDRELAYVEALGIRNPVRSLGAGRVAAVRVQDGQPVEYGQVLFEIARV